MWEGPEGLGRAEQAPFPNHHIATPSHSGSGPGQARPGQGEPAASLRWREASQRPVLGLGRCSSSQPGN